jgi:hypothetical protein
MTITICSSLSFIDRILAVTKELRAMGHVVLLPASAEMVARGTLTQQEITKEKDSETGFTRTIRQDAIRGHHAKIMASDAILVLNEEKSGIPGYIGGSVFLEMGFAHVAHKRIFLLYPIPDMPYSDEIRAMEPTIVHGNTRLIV